jgi:hypothetical protein
LQTIDEQEKVGVGSTVDNSTFLGRTQMGEAILFIIDACRADAFDHASISLQAVQHLKE